MVDVQMRQVWNEVVAHQEAHQDPVIYYVLQVVLKGKLWLNKHGNNKISEKNNKKK